jgi:hypothetical protein
MAQTSIVGRALQHIRHWILLCRILLRDLPVNRERSFVVAVLVESFPQFLPQKETLEFSHPCKAKGYRDKFELADELAPD